MATATASATQTFTVEIPADKVAFVKTFFKELGFNFKKEKTTKKSSIERSIEDFDSGHYYTATTEEELLDLLHE